MASKVAFKVIKITSDAFNGPRYFAHVPGVGFCVIPNEGDTFERNVMKFNPESLYDQSEVVTRMAMLEKQHPGYNLSTVTLEGLVAV